MAKRPKARDVMEAEKRSKIMKAEAAKAEQDHLILTYLRGDKDVDDDDDDDDDDAVTNSAASVNPPKRAAALWALAIVIALVWWAMGPREIMRALVGPSDPSHQKYRGASVIGADSYSDDREDWDPPPAQRVRSRLATRR